MKSSFIVIGFAVGLAFLCLVLGIVTYVPAREIKAGFESIFTVFKYLTISLAIALGLAGIILMTGGLVVTVIWAWPKATLGLRERKASVAKAEAEAEKAKREAALVVTVAPPGSPVIATTYQDGQISHNPLHLLGDPQRWPFWVMNESINRRSNEKLISEPQIIEAEPPELPERVDLIDHIRQPSLRNIFLGLHVNGHQLAEVRAPIWALVHIANGGSTDTGKSNMERGIAYQVSLCDNVQTVFCDLKRQTFKPFYRSDRLLYPIVTDLDDFIACIGELKAESDRRLKLFEDDLIVETIHDYNKKVDQPLPYIVAFVDEISNIFTSKEAHNRFLELIRMSRASGIYFICAGQSWSHRVLTPDTRQQFRTAFHFATNDANSSRMLLNDGRATTIEVQGRAFASLPFGLAKEVIEVQTPFIDLQTVAETFNGSGRSILDLPVKVMDETDESADEMFIRLVGEGMTRTDASWLAYQRAYEGTSHVRRCKRLLGEI